MTTTDPLPAGRLPAVLYVCGHGHSGVLHYQAHGLQWARRGYACLIVDTTEQHDNPGEHHGLYYGLHDEWISLGYSGAGGELWNSLRGLDVLCALPEVDPARIGATGISGGGAHSLFVGLADDRVRAVATACGVALSPWTLAHRHLLNHCD
ncbi:MAG TPA: acetylxylan esterase, partial [Mycobacterium sp.]|nr:acetylxylan esterase [Mycobacterium sp.]